MSDRLTEFENFYYTSKPLYTGEFGISTYLTNFRSYELFKANIEQQRGILLAIPFVIELRILEVTALVTADLITGELNEAKLLFKHGFLRASGALAGVALEAHLKLLHKQSGLIYNDQDTIVPLAVRLRIKDFITLGDEKKCIAMSDTRNKCDHKNTLDPQEKDVAELIDDVDRFTKRVQIV